PEQQSERLFSFFYFLREGVILPFSLFQSVIILPENLLDESS
ncbi:hypothetical protein VT98_12114, partial [Candidatus Electrothrix communis]